MFFFADQETIIAVHFASLIHLHRRCRQWSSMRSRLAATLPWSHDRYSENRRAPSAAVLRRRCCHRPGMRATIGRLSLSASFAPPTDCHVCPGHMTGIPKTDALLLLQFFAAGAAITQDAGDDRSNFLFQPASRRQLTDALPWPTDFPETDALLLLQFFAAGAAIAQGCGRRSADFPFRPASRRRLTATLPWPRFFSCSSSSPVLPSPRNTGDDRLHCPGPDGFSGNRRAPSAAGLRRRRCHHPGCGRRSV